MIRESLTTRLKRNSDQAPGHGPGGNCWIWKISKNPLGYGLMKVNGKTARAHRVAFMLANGRWPEGLVLHKCDNPPCVNPDHLFEGTDGDNARDRMRKGRGARGERMGVNKLKESDIHEIRSLSRAGLKPAEISRRFSVVPCTIIQVVKGQSWGWLEEPAEFKEAISKATPGLVLETA